MKKTLNWLTKLFLTLICVGALFVSAAQAAAPQESFKVGFVVYDNTDLLTQSVIKYLKEEISPVFNIEFIVSDAIKDSNQEISFFENCAAKGAKGIIAFYTVTDPKIRYRKAKQLGLYYIFGARIPELKEMEAAGDNPFFLGGIGASSADYKVSYEMAKTFMDGGARKIGMATGGKDFGVRLFVDRYKGVKDAIKDFESAHPGTKIQFDEFGGFPNDAWFAGQAKMIASNPDAIIAYSAEFLWVQALTNAGKAGKIKLGTFAGMFPIPAQAVYDNKIHYLGAIYPSMIGLPFALLYNAMTGYSADFRDNGKPVSIDLEMPVIQSPKEMKDWMEIIDGPVRPYSADDLKMVCKKFNPKANYSDLFKLCEAASYDEVVARIKKK